MISVFSVINHARPMSWIAMFSDERTPSRRFRWRDFVSMGRNRDSLEKTASCEERRRPEPRLMTEESCSFDRMIPRVATNFFYAPTRQRCPEGVPNRLTAALGSRPHPVTELPSHIARSEVYDWNPPTNTYPPPASHFNASYAIPDTGGSLS